REPAEQQGHARDVAVVLAGLVGAPEDDVVDRLAREAVPLDHRLDRAGREIVRPDGRENAAVAPDGRADGVDDHRVACLRHRPILATIAVSTIRCSASVWWSWGCWSSGSSSRSASGIRAPG